MEVTIVQKPYDFRKIPVIVRLNDIPNSNPVLWETSTWRGERAEAAAGRRLRLGKLEAAVFEAHGYLDPLGKS